MKSSYFSLVELVSPAILENLSPEAAWRLVAPFIPGLDLLRTMHGSRIFVNRPKLGLVNCGVRSLACGVGARLSRHKGYGGVQAFDVSADDMVALEATVRAHAKACGIVRMENPRKTVTWLHVELLGHQHDDCLVVFDP
jgi:hypothetical protein